MLHEWIARPAWPRQRASRPARSGISAAAGADSGVIQWPHPDRNTLRSPAAPFAASLPIRRTSLDARRLLVLQPLCCWSLVTSADAAAENWPGWRGPRGDGTSHEPDIPTTWGAERERRLESRTCPARDMPRRSSGATGSSSPRVWKSRNSDCSSASTAPAGKQLWQQVVLEARRSKTSTSSTALPRARPPPTASSCTSRFSTRPRWSSRRYDYLRRAEVAGSSRWVFEQARLLQLSRAVRRQGDRQRRSRRRCLPGGARIKPPAARAGKSIARTKLAATSRRSFAKSTAARR